MTSNGRPPIGTSVPIDVASRPRSVADRRAEDGDPAARLGDGASVRNVALPDVVGADRGVRRRRADDRRRGRRSAGGHDRLRLELGRDGGHAVDLGDRGGIVEGQRSSWRRSAGRADREEVRAEAVEPRRDLRRRALADARRARRPKRRR